MTGINDLKVTDTGAPITDINTTPTLSTLKVTDQWPKLQEGYNQVETMDPDRIARIKKATQQFDIEPAFADKHLDKVEKAMQTPPTSFFEELERDYPGTTEFLSKPQNMAIAKDDLENLSFFERQKNNLKTGYQRGDLNVRQSELGWNQMMETLLSGEMSNTGEDELQSLEKQMQEMEPEPDISPLYYAAQQAPNFILMGRKAAQRGVDLGIIGGAAGGVALGPAGVGPGAVTGTGAGLAFGVAEAGAILEGGSAFREFVPIEGVDPRTKAAAALVVGGINAGLEYVSLKALTKTIPGAEQFMEKFSSKAPVLQKLSGKRAVINAMKNYLMSIGTEVGTEILQEATTATAGQLLQGEIKPKEIAERSAQVISPTIQSAALFGFPGTALNLGIEAKKAYRAQAEKKAYLAMGEAAKTSKTRGRDAQTHREHIETVTKDSEIKDVYLNREAFQTYFQEKGIDPELVAQELGISEQYKSEERAGGDLQIDFATWVDKVVATEHYAALADDVKFDANGYTTKEWNAKQEGLKQEIEAEQAQAQAKIEENTALQKDYDEVYSYISEGMRQAGYKNNTEIDSNAKIWASHAIVESQRRGQTVQEWFQGINRPQVQQVSPGTAESLFQKGPNEIDQNEFILPENVSITETQTVSKISPKQPNNAIVKTVKNSLSGLQGKSVTNKSTGMNILISGAGISKTISHGIGKLKKRELAFNEHFQALEKIDQLIENAVYLTQSVDNKNRDKNYRYLFAPMSMNGRNYLVKITLKDSQQGLTFYSHDVISAGDQAAKGQSNESIDRTSPAENIAIKDFLNTVNAKRQEKSFFQAAAYHGSPHRFDKFELQKIGTGEGAQAYGWGLYFTESKDIAEWYREKLVERANRPSYFYRGEVVHEYEISNRAMEGDLLATALRALIATKGNKEAALYNLEQESIEAERNVEYQIRLAKELPPLNIKDFQKKKDAGFSFSDDSTSDIYSLELSADRLNKNTSTRIEIYVYRIGEEIKNIEVFHDSYKIAGMETMDQLENFLDGIERDKYAWSADYLKFKDRVVQTLRGIDQNDFEVRAPEEKGQLYKVEIPAKTNMLDLERASSQQYKKVREGLKKLEKDLGLKNLSAPEKIQYWDVVDADGARVNQFRGDLREDAEYEAQEIGGKVVSKIETIDLSGKDIYRELSTHLGSEEAASRKLAEYGILGLRYLDGSSRRKGKGNYNFVIFDDSLVSIEETYYQDREKPRGAVSFPTPDSAVISIFKAKDQSTFIHESAHIWLKDTLDFIQKGEASEQYKQDWETLKTWLDFRDDQTEFTVEQQEKFARGFEAYVMEGKAPSRKLEKAFATFKKWLTRIYRTAKSLNVELTDDVRGVMDRMLATEQEIEEAAQRLSTREELSLQEVPSETIAKLDTLRERAREKADKKAQQLFDGVKDKLPKAHQDKIQATIDSKTIFDKSVTVWGEVKDLKLADGSPNIEAMQTAILGMKGYKPEQKTKIFDFVQSKAAEAETFRKAKLHSDDIALQNEFIKIKKDPESDNKLEKGLAIIAKLGGDNITMANRRKILEETLNKEGLGNKVLAYEYIKKAESGQTYRGEIETAYNEEKINLSQRNTALDALNKYDTGAEDKAKKRVDQKIETLIKEDYKDKKQQAEILYQYRELSNGKDPIEAEKIYNDLIKEVPGTGSWFFDTGKKKQFEVSAEQAGPTNTAWNKLYVDMGKQDAMSLLEAVRLQTGRDPNPADIESFAQEMGGYSALKEGGPVHNAIMTLNRANFRVTLQNIRDVLKQTNGTGIAE